MQSFAIGVGGNATYSGVAHQVLDWTFSASQEVIDITNSGSGGYTEKVYGVKDGSGSFSSPYDGGVLVPPSLGASVAFSFVLGDAPGKSISGNAIIRSVDFNMPARGDAVKFTANFETTGTFTVTA